MPKAMVLCAGLGTRLRPVTERWPKPALPLLGQPLLRYALAQLARGGVQALGINSHHLPEVMERVAGEECARLGWPLHVSREEREIQGTGGGIRGLRSFLDDDTFVVMNGDVLFSFDLPAVLAAHRASGAAATMVLLPLPAGESYAAVELDTDGWVRRIAGKGPGGERLSPWHFTGVHVMTPTVFDFMRPTGPEDINREVYLRMVEAGVGVRGVVLDPASVYWSDLGTPQRYLATHRDLLQGKVPLPGGSPFDGLARQGLTWAAPSAKVAAAPSGPAYFAERACVESGVRLGAHVSVGRGVVVHSGAELGDDVAVLDGSEVPAGARLAQCLWADGLIARASG